MASAKPTLHSQLSMKDAQISQLERQLSAAASRASHLQRRLFLTLDALDAVQRSNDAELEAEVRAREGLRRLYNRQSDLLRRAEAERDGLRNATNAWLAEGHSRVPFSADRINLSQPLEAALQRRCLPSPDIPAERTLQAALVTSLRQERDRERSAHARTLRDADRVISSLQASLALREAELEACVAHPDHATLLPKSSLVSSPRSNKAAKARAALFKVPPADVTSVLDNAIAANTTLQADNEALIRELDRIQLAISQPLPPPPSSSFDKPFRLLSSSRPVSPGVFKPLSHSDSATPTSTACTPSPSPSGHAPIVASPTPTRSRPHCGDGDDKITMRTHLREMRNEHARLLEVISAADELFDLPMSTSTAPTSSSQSLVTHDVLQRSAEACAARLSALETSFQFTRDTSPESSPVTTPTPTKRELVEDDGGWEASMELATPLSDAQILPDTDEDLEEDDDEAAKGQGEISMELSTPLNALNDLPPFSPGASDDAQDTDYECEGAVDSIPTAHAHDEDADDADLESTDGDGSPTLHHSPTVTLVPGTQLGGAAPFWVPSTLPKAEAGTEPWAGKGDRYRVRGGRWLT